MKYISLRMSIETNLNGATIGLKPDEYKAIHKAQHYVNNTIEGYVRKGIILEENRPKLIVMYDNLAKSKICIPGNVHTTHMSLTYHYNLSRLSSYEQFKKLIDEEPEFVKDVNKRFLRTKQKADLRAQSTFQGIQYYVDVFGFPNYESKDDLDIYDVLKYEYRYELGKDHDFKRFQLVVYHMIQRIDMLYGMSGGKFAADNMWINLFSDIISRTGRIYYDRQCDTKQFRDMYYLYDSENLKKRQGINDTHKGEYTAPPKRKVKKHTHTKDDPVLVFMGLPPGFNQKQLKKRFRKLAVKYHPDKHCGDNDKFVYLKECYDTLLKKK